MNENKLNESKQKPVKRKKKKKNTHFRDILSLCDWSTVFYPVFSYKHASLPLRNELKNLIKLLNKMEQLNTTAENLQVSINESGKRLNLFINNLFHLKPKFHFKKHFIKLNHRSLEIHDHFELNEAIVNNELNDYQLEDCEDLILTIKPNHRTFKINQQQRQLCQDLCDEYNTFHGEYEFCEEKYQSLLDLYLQVLEIIKYELTSIPILAINSSKPESFDDDIHELITLKINNHIELFYVRKEYYSDFLNTILK